jgi:two-component system, chemotaxis family, response regulator Rcp1
MSLLSPHAEYIRLKGIGMSVDISERGPIVADASEGRASQHFTAPRALHRKNNELRILVVEDDAADAYLIRRALKAIPRVAEVVLAEDGIEALDLIERGAVKPDLAFVDLRMPRKDGFALLRDLAFSEGAKFPAVVLTSSKSGEDTMRSKKRGAIQFVTKPRTEQKLAAALGRVIAMI